MGATEEELDGMRDHQLKGILMQLQQSITEWDSEKCPTVKAHVERLKSQEPEEVDAEVVDKDSSEVDLEDSVEEVDEDDEDEDQEEPADGGALCLIVSLPIILAMSLLSTYC